VGVELTWFGHSCFRLRGREATVITDPPSSSLGYSRGQQQADIITISHQHPGHNNKDFCGDQCLVIAGPGEYEAAGVFVTGVPTFHDTQEGKERGKNTIFAIAIDDVTIGHLGDLGHPLSAQTKEALGQVDVLLVPVGGRSTIDAAKAAELVASMEVKLVVPMHYRTTAEHTADLAPVERFFKEMGRPESAPLAKLNVTRSSLPAETQVVVLEPLGKRGGAGR
jgi:L-ascorbate metabolism protein UlaG (beta-lactamase superfamily)